MLALLLASCLGDFAGVEKVSSFLDPTNADLDDGIFHVGDEVKIIGEANVGGPGSDDSGLGAWVTFYVVSGAQVVKTEVVQPSGPVGQPGTVFNAIPVRKMDAAPDGCGKRYGGCPGNSGTLTGGQLDAGIFFSTDPRTAYDANLQPSSTINPTGVDASKIFNRWDYDQTLCYGVKSSGVGLDGKGVTLLFQDAQGTYHGSGSPVAGPDVYYKNDCDPTRGSSYPSLISGVGPWRRIAYANSQMASSAQIVPSTNGGDIATTDTAVPTSAGVQLSTAGPLPFRTNAVRFTAGKRQKPNFDYFRITYRITNVATFLAASSSVCATGTGSDSTEGSPVKDHPWRYWQALNTNKCLDICAGAPPCVGDDCVPQFNAKMVVTASDSTKVYPPSGILHGYVYADFSKVTMHAFFFEVVFLVFTHLFYNPD